MASYVAVLYADVCAVVGREVDGSDGGWSYSPVHYYVSAGDAVYGERDAGTAVADVLGVFARLVDGIAGA